MPSRLALYGHYRVTINRDGCFELPPRWQNAYEKFRWRCFSSFDDNAPDEGEDDAECLQLWPATNERDDAMATLTKDGVVCLSRASRDSALGPCVLLGLGDHFELWPAEELQRQVKQLLDESAGPVDTGDLDTGLE